MIYPTQSSNRLPQAWIDILISKLYQYCTSLSTLTLEGKCIFMLPDLSTLQLIDEPIQKVWADFNADMVYWHGLKQFVQEGLLLYSDLPPKPVAENYI